MTVRSSTYPLDVSTRFPKSVIDQFPVVRARDRISGLTVHPDTDDLTNEVLYRLVKSVWANSHRALAYCDVMDLAQEAAGARLQVLEQGLQAVRTDIAGLQSSINSVVAFLGIVIPAWLNKEEVERGDDMGIVRPSAAELGLVVTFEFDRLLPGFGHEDVVSIVPAPGTLVARGSTVTVRLNLQG